MRAWRRRYWRAWRFRIGIAVMALSYVLVALDIPLPAYVHKETDQPFPCQDHPCGCQTAEQCWRSCCCFTPEQRWAWARARGIEPPAYAEKPAVQGWSSVKLRDRDQQISSPAKRSCCREKPSRQTDAPAKKSCCQAAARCQECGDQSPAIKKNTVRWGSAMTAWRCQGLNTMWVSIGAVAPVPPTRTWSPEMTLIACISFTNEVPQTLPLNPPSPPPRRSVG